MTRELRILVAVGMMLGVLPSARLLAQGNQPGAADADRRLVATPTSDPIGVDGVLDEAAWQEASVASGFTQSEPDEGQPATEDTMVRVLYDQTTLYIGIVAHDSEPERIVINELNKDFDAQGGDAVEIVLDTFHDQRNGYLFSTNAAGAKYDAQMVNEGREVNSDWDGIWHVNSRVTDTGWTAEVAIPFRTLKFLNENPQTWGINFLRRLSRRTEESYWAPVPRNYRLARVSLAGTLEGLRGLQDGRDLRIKPYATTSATQIGAGSTQGDADVGFDLKYGVGTGLVLDATINTDFSQVESDEQQINLTRVSLFFPEKREFFLENSGVFQFGSGDERGQTSRTRRVTGSSNSRLNEVAQPGNDLIMFFSRRIGLNDAGEAIPILAGGRLTGQVGAYSVGVMNIQQREGEFSPATNFTALRARRQLLANSDIGVLFLNKDAGSHYNRSMGADANFRFFTNLNLNAFLVKTFSPSGAVPETGNDMSSRLSFNYPSATWSLRGSYTTIGERFNNEIGFVPRLGIKKSDVAAGYRFRPQAISRWIREVYPHYELHHIGRWEGDLDSRYQDYHVVLNFQDNSRTEPGYNTNVENLLTPFVLNSRRNIVIQPGRYAFDEYFVWYTPDPTDVVGITARFATGEFYSGTTKSYRIGADIRGSERLNVQTTLTHNRFRLPEGDFNTNLLSSRISYSFSTRAFINALIQYNSDARQWSSNIRFNFIHRPLSDFFIVYNDQRDSKGGGLLNRALIAKMTYLLSF